MKGENRTMETNVVAFPPLAEQSRRAAYDRIQDWRVWTVRRDGRRIVTAYDMTFQVWVNYRRVWNWRIDYRDGGRISGRDYRTPESARGQAIWADCCRRWGERAA
jgi:hypothetical protein